MSESFPAIDRAAARRRFERAASTYHDASRLETEVGSRMLERLDYVKIRPRRILDAGSGPAREARQLRSRYREAQVVALDFSLAMLRSAKEGFFEKKTLKVCADLARLPLEAGSVDLVWSNLALPWVDAPAALRELERVLAPGGLLMLSSLGPDTLQELRAAAGAARVHTFLDMHDLGDMLVAAGLSAPVVDMEKLTIDYGRGERLLDDLRASGQTLARADRARGLAGKGFLTRLRSRLSARASFEVVYAHAWKVEQAKTIRIFKRLP